MEFLNQVTYGNPTYEMKILLEKKCLVGDLFEELSREPYPKNDSEATKQELNEIVGALKDLDTMNPTLLRRYINYDRALIPYIENILKADPNRIPTL